MLSIRLRRFIFIVYFCVGFPLALIFALGLFLSIWFWWSPPYEGVQEGPEPTHIQALCIQFLSLSFLLYFGACSFLTWRHPSRRRLRWFHLFGAVISIGLLLLALSWPLIEPPERPFVVGYLAIISSFPIYGFFVFQPRNRANIKGRIQ